jgi:hypothetical protein
MNAAVKIGNCELKGDIELHLLASDWLTHGHHKDSAYNNVILHVVCVNDLKQHQREQLPPMLVLKPSEKVKSGVRKGRCAEILNNMDVEEARELFVKAGAYRFNSKSERFVRQIIIEGKEQGFWRFMFEAAGYKHNTKAFNVLFKRFLSHPESSRQENYEAILWGESGLLPDLSKDEIHKEIKEFTRSCWNSWWRMRQQGLEPIKWKSGGRPANSPERRLAVLVKWIKEFGNEPLKDIGNKLMELSPEGFVKFLLSKMQVSDCLWDNFVNFSTKKYSLAKICGRSFALEVAVNVVLPAIYAMTSFDIFDNSRDIAVKVEKAWRILPVTQENAITRKAGELWFTSSKSKRDILNSAASRQGAIHVYREYCEKCQHDCKACKWLRY